MKRNGFTLVELLVVISIITILAAIVVPNIGKLLERGKRGKAAADLKQLADAVKFYYTDHGAFPEELDALVDENYLSKQLPETPWGGEYHYVYADGTESSGTGEGGEGENTVIFLDQPDTKIGFRIYVDRYDDPAAGTTGEGTGEEPGTGEGGPEETTVRKPICYVEEKFE